MALLLGHVRHAALGVALEHDEVARALADLRRLARVCHGRDDDVDAERAGCERLGALEQAQLHAAVRRCLGG